MIDPTGVSLIVCGLDHWYEREPGERSNGNIAKEEYRIEEPRLSSLLEVDYFMAPPDHRVWNRYDWERSNANVPNMELTVPFLRFPTWHFCPSCKLMCKQPLSAQGYIECMECRGEKKTNRRMMQVLFVGICPAGHIQDVLWDEWVHDSLQPDCRGQLKMLATGVSSLAGQKVRCELCGRERSLSELLRPVDNDKAPLYMKCLGQRVWFGEDRRSNAPLCEGDFKCKQVLQVVPRNAANIYYPVVESALYIPQPDDKARRQLMKLLDCASTQTVYSLVKDWLAQDVNLPIEKLARLIITLNPNFKDFTPTELERALQEMRSDLDATVSDASDGSDDRAEKSSWASGFRSVEYDILRQERMDRDLIVRESSVDKYRADVAQYFSKIMLVPRLRATRALAGFSRLWYGSSRKDIKMLWQKLPPDGDRWLPACVVYGEGIFFEFNEHKLREWEQNGAVQDRLKPLYESLRENSRLIRSVYPIPRLVLLHTFAHVLMNRLVFECGYSVASLSERLYVHDGPLGAMAGVLIYTSSGDAQGTMGGLVRMGKPGYLEPTIQRAMRAATWCSADPVCMGSAKSVQSDSTLQNLAACHNCALVPEVSCELLNCLLDRGLLIGSHDNPEIGYFCKLVSQSHSG